MLYGQNILNIAGQRKQIDDAKAEADARARTVDLGRVIPALITSIATGNPTPLILAGTGEAARAATGSQTDIAGLSQMAGQQFMPTQGQEQSGMGAFGTMPQPREQSQQNAFMQMLAQSGKLPMESFEHGGVKYKRENFMDQMMNSPAGMQMMEQLLQGFGGGGMPSAFDASVGSQEPEVIKKLRAAGATQAEIDQVKKELGVQ
jgi:hypothetical protein